MCNERDFRNVAALSGWYSIKNHPWTVMSDSSKDTAMRTLTHNRRNIACGPLILQQSRINDMRLWQWIVVSEGHRPGSVPREGQPSTRLNRTCVVLPAGRPKQCELVLLEAGFFT